MGGGIGGVILVVIYLLLGGDALALLDSQQQAQLSQRGQIDNQRVRWFRRGYETGDLRQRDTFNAPDL